MIYDIYLLQLDSHSVKVVGKLVKRKGKRQLYTRGEILDKQFTNTEIHKIESKNTKQENKHTKNIKKDIYSYIVIRK